MLRRREVCGGVSLMEFIAKLALIDWMAIACVVAAVILVVAAEQGILGQNRVVAVAAIAVLGVSFATVLFVSDVEDSVFLNIGPPPEEASSSKTKRSGEEKNGNGEDAAEAGKDESGPGDGDGGAGDTIKLGAAKGPEQQGGEGEMHGVANKKKGGQQGGVDKKGGDQAEMESQDGGGSSNSGSSENSGSSGSDQGQQQAKNGGNGKGNKGDEKGGDGQQDEFPVLKEAAAAAGGSLQDCPDCPRMVLVVHGAFEMGSKPEEPGYGPEQGPVKTVRFRNPFYVGRFEVTRAEFAYFVKETKYEPSKGCVVGGRWLADHNWEKPGFVQDANHPVVCINWHDAVAYVKWLTRTTKQTYRLPSESEWEYTARAGGKTIFGNGDELQPQDANYAFRSFGTLSGGQFKANAFGIQDMMGNAWEMTGDCWEPNYEKLPLDGRPQLRDDCDKRVMRGGAWYSGPRFLRSATRWANLGAAAGNGVGFRVVRNFVPEDLKKTKGKNGKPVAATSVEHKPISAQDIERAAAEELRKQAAMPAVVKPAETPPAAIAPAAPAAPIAAEPKVETPASREAKATGVLPAAAAGAIAAAAGAAAAKKVAADSAENVKTGKKSKAKKK